MLTCSTTSRAQTTSNLCGDGDDGDDGDDDDDDDDDDDHAALAISSIPQFL